MIFEYGQYLVPAGDLGSLAQGSAARLVRFLSWAQNPHIKRVNIAFCLSADRVAEVNDRLVQNPYVTAVEVPLPDRDQRRAYVDAQANEQEAPPEVIDVLWLRRSRPMRAQSTPSLKG